jgi:hypothetical protein
MGNDENCFTLAGIPVRIVGPSPCLEKALSSGISSIDSLGISKQNADIQSLNEIRRLRYGRPTPKAAVEGDKRPVTTKGQKGLAGRHKEQQLALQEICN